MTTNARPPIPLRTIGYRDKMLMTLAQRRQTARRRFGEELILRLAEGAQPAETMFAIGNDMGVSKRTMMRAKAELGVVSVRVRDGWLWRLKMPVADGKDAS